MAAFSTDGKSIENERCTIRRQTSLIEEVEQTFMSLFVTENGNSTELLRAPTFPRLSNSSIVLQSNEQAPLIYRLIDHENDNSIDTDLGSWKCHEKKDSEGNFDRRYIRQLLNRTSNHWTGSETDRQQVFHLLERSPQPCTIPPEYVARLAHSLSKRAEEMPDQSLRTSMLHEALALSKMALKSDENCALCHFAYGHIIGILLKTKKFPWKKKLNDAYIFKYHMEKTIELDQDFFEAYAYLGRYEYTAYDLSLFERKAVAMLGYTVEGNLDKALKYLLISLEGKGDMLHTVYLLIGKIYQKKKQYTEARKYLNLCIRLSIERKSEIDVINEAKNLLKDNKIRNSSF